MPTGTAPVDGPACLTPEQAVQWATTMLRPGVALVIGISIPTGSAAATEIAVLDTDGRVRAHDWLGEGSSRALHTMVQAVGSRHLLAYNAANVRDWVVVDALRAGVRVGPLADPRRWGCIMRARSMALGTPDRLYPLGTTRGAVAAAGQALTLVQDIAQRRAIGGSAGTDVGRAAPG
ncbi:hypothetical protein [Nakamurella multipartita]|jgi:hypothetical protein|uniref:3'-5' exonuclease n=1 Tax=Nakamurella multipartita (strain ATCC 700099 / DSM 44233 / CIP 104796 / JCM 9543 / NBRC 105858 / Y-104) TaxID=479431 RepID=C8XB80_NAKMY|nr:hypothetical protein [Nakamurella multipartita]ACV81372.1 hypothetical protein Namu_5102 [Nakamurella multipartita DSM 44233]